MCKRQRVLVSVVMGCSNKEAKMAVKGCILVFALSDPSVKMLSTLPPWKNEEDLERILLLQLHPMYRGELLRCLGYV